MDRPAPVTSKGIFSCAHSGTMSLQATSKLTVDTHPVQTFSSGGYTGSYDNCKNPQNAGGQCASTTPVPPTGNPGSATKLTIGSSPALLSELTANTMPAATPLQSVDPGQTKLTAS